MNQSEMLHEMCQEVLAEGDIKAICKSRGLPNQAVSSRKLFESLFLSDTGVAAVLRQLDRTEIALLHMLSGQNKPVDITFFRPLDPPPEKDWHFRTITQRFQGVFNKMKDRLLRRGVLLCVLAPETWEKTSKMERWQFALPAPMARHLPPLIESAKRLATPGDCRSEVARDKLTGVGQGADGDSKNDRVEIVSGELRWGGEPFQVDRVAEWQMRQWRGETAPTTRRKEANPNALPPAEAAFRILASLEAGFWSDADGLAAPLKVFSDAQVDAHAICESGYRWGLLARHMAEGRAWYRPAPAAADADVPPDRYLTDHGNEGVHVKLGVIPLETLETLVLISDQRPVPGREPRLLVTPNLCKLGRKAETIAALPLADWLHKHSPAFHQALETVQERRGKTILHENLLVARVGDLSLKVALEKTLKGRIVPLGEEFIAFPADAQAEVKRLVTQMGHVVKEAHAST
ncbi:MAG: hypothetical protein ACKV0T_27610 [Planctomycetales bacterium]